MLKLVELKFNKFSHLVINFFYYIHIYISKGVMKKIYKKQFTNKHKKTIFSTYITKIIEYIIIAYLRPKIFA